jgi:hypothetical protein
MKKWMSVILVFYVSSMAIAGSGSPIKIEIRPVFDDAGPSSVEMKADDGAIFHVSKKALLTEKDLSDASVTPAGEQSTLNVTLSDPGAKEMKKFT